MERALLVDHLQRARDVLMARRERVAFYSRRAQADFRVSGREDAVPSWAFRLPTPSDAFVPVAEIFSRKSEVSVRLESDELSELLCKRGRAVRSETHHLELVAVVRKTQMLRDCGVQHAERMRKETFDSSSMVFLSPIAVEVMT